MTNESDYQHYLRLTVSKPTMLHLPSNVQITTSVCPYMTEGSFIKLIFFLYVAHTFSFTFVALALKLVIITNWLKVTCITVHIYSISSPP